MFAVMIISNIKLKNWKNFRSVEAALQRRVFLIGPNASGKSNFMDAIRFLRDIAKPEGGGLQKAVADRGGVSTIRCLSSGKDSPIEVEVGLSEMPGKESEWKYAIGVKQPGGANRAPCVLFEKVWKDGNPILVRPDEDDEKDKIRLRQTHLEQVNSNLKFREVASFLSSVNYFHLVPQLLKYPDLSMGSAGEEDPFGQSFLEKIGRTPEKTRKFRLQKIEGILKTAVPQLKKLSQSRDVRGIPHLEAIYEHWKPNAGRIRENQFSDGTLRLFALLWSVLDGESPLLLEEPELSLHASIVKQLPGLMWRLQPEEKRQIMLSTHSRELLADPGIGGEEVLLFHPGAEGTNIRSACADNEIGTLLEAGISLADIVIQSRAGLG